jgi:hypothetical protein
MIKDLGKTIRQEIRNYISERNCVFDPKSLSEIEKEVLDGLEKDGYYVIPDYYTPEKCDEIIDEIERLRKDFWDHVHYVADCDARFFGANRVSEAISDFAEDPFIVRIARIHEQYEDLNILTMAARLDFREGNPGSGSGWHRDRAGRKQTKSIIYLSDVTEEHGPFQYIRGSHAAKQVIKGVAYSGFHHNQTRFTDDEIEKYLNHRKGELETFTAKKGTLILVNTRGIHRGMPIMKENRYALTNYIWPGPISPKVEEMAIPIPQKSGN